LDLLWHDAAGTNPKAAGVPLDKYFRGAEVAVLRSDWENPQALFVGFKAGNNKANHSHLDLGSFVFDAAGVRWAVDLGADDYNLPGYFGNQRWNYYRLRAEGQNTLVINPGDQPDQDPAAAAQIVRFQPGTDRAFAVADLSTAYRTSARKVWRGIALLDRAKVVVQDEIQADKPVELWWFMHTPASVKIEDDGRTATLQQVGKKLRAEILSPTEARFQLMDAQPLPASPHPERQAKNANTRKLAIHMAGIRNSVLTVVLTPNPSMDEASVQQVKVSTLSDW
jgi:Heparinase II/III-like protein